MQPVEMYMRPMCGFCAAAKRLLDAKGVSYSEINIWVEAGRKAEMVQRSNGRQTVPQIFVGDTHVGGFDDLSALERAGKLDAILAG